MHKDLYDTRIDKRLANSCCIKQQTLTTNYCLIYVSSVFKIVRKRIEKSSSDSADWDYKSAESVKCSAENF